MATTTRPPTGPQPWALIVLGVASGTAVCIAGFPGIAAIWVACITVGWTARPPQLTGTKRANTPTPAGPGERDKMNRYTRWAAMKWGMFPNAMWLPGEKVRLSWLWAVTTAAGAVMIPQQRWQFAIINEVCAFATVTGAMAARRKGAAEDAECPAVNVADIRNAPVTAWAAGGVTAVAAAVAGVIAGLPFTVVAAAVVVAVFAVPSIVATKRTLAPWWALVKRRREWAPVWEVTLGAGAVQPKMTATRQVGEAVVDTYEYPAGAQTLFDRRGLGSTFDPGYEYALLDVPAEGANGPIPGTIHPQRLEIAAWPLGQVPSLADVDDPDLAALLFRSIAAWSWGAIPGGRNAFIECEKVSVEPEPDEDDDDPAGVQPGPRLWCANFAVPDWYLLDVNGFISKAKCQVVADTINGCLYAGAAITDVTLDDRDWYGYTADKYAEALIDTAAWHKTWGAALPRPELQRPAYYPTTKKVRRFATSSGQTGQVIHSTFARNHGASANWAEYAGVEPRLRSTLANQLATFAARLAVRVDGRPGTRSDTYFAVAWSADPVPNIDALTPDSDRDAAEWIITGHLNLAFDAVKLARPEVISTRCLSSTARGKGHLWRAELRMFDGVTVAEVRTRRESLEALLRIPYLRVVQADEADKLVLFVGQPVTSIARKPGVSYAEVAAADWQHAFLKAKVTGADGRTPEFVSAEPLERNPQVEATTFALPSSLEPNAVKAAIKALKSASGKKFIQWQPTSNPSEACLLVAAEDPMPTMVGADFEAIDATDKLPFATYIDGEYAYFDPTVEPHLLFIGATGSGKELAAATIVPVNNLGRFPSGWARNDELEVGDTVYAADGSVTTIIGFSEWTDKYDSYRLTFDDGQTVIAGAPHLWRVSDRASRGAYTPRKDARRSAWAERQRAAADAIREVAAGLPVGTFGTVMDVVRLLGADTSIKKFYDFADRAGIPYQDTMQPTAAQESITSMRQVTVYRVSDSGPALVSAFGSSTLREANVTAAAAGRFALDAGPDEWMSAREMLVALTGTNGWAKKHVLAVSRRLDADGVSSKPIEQALTRPRGECLRRVRWYHLNEFLLAWADYVEHTGDASKSGLAAPPLERVVDTATMFESQRHTTGSGDWVNWAIRVSAAGGDDAALPIDPYTLGAWLGDGTSSCGDIASASVQSCTDSNGITDQAHMIRQLSDVGYPAEPGGSAPHHLLKVSTLRPDLKAAGLLNNKHIPALYKRASFDQRLAVLQGLMDTDGTIDTNGSCELTLSDERLATDALELIRSLGIKATIHTSEAGYKTENGVYIRCKDRHRMSFTTDLPVFRLPRKLERIPTEVRDTQKWLYVTSIEKVPNERNRCISVEHPTGMFHVEGFIPTHNSVTLQTLLYGALAHGWDAYMADAIKRCGDFRFAEPWCKAFATNVFATAAMMQAVYAEVRRRVDLNSAHGVGSVFDLPEDVRPPRSVIMLDEFTSLMMPNPVPPKSSDPEAQAARESVLRENAAKTIVGMLVGKVAREARSAGFDLVLATQALKASTLEKLPGGDDLKDLALDSMLPVPVSERFPTGWARNDELEVGDVLYAPSGEMTRIVGFSNQMWQTDAYEVEFDDGQVVRCGGGHLWAASTERSRRDRRRRRGGRAEQSWRLETATRELAALAGDDAAATVDELACLVGYKARVSALNVLRQHHLEPVEGDRYSVRAFLTAIIEVSAAATRTLGEDSVVTTATMAGSVANPRGKGASNWAVRNTTPVDGPDADLPVDPYVFGAWLGDGSSAAGVITSSAAASCTDDTGLTDQAHMVDQLECAGHAPKVLACSDRLIGTRGLHVPLRELGVQNNKHIPAIYLRASYQQRLALLQGLMDTDGSVNAVGQCFFIVTREDLAVGVLELVRSLGIKATLTSWPAVIVQGDVRRTTGTAYCVAFRTRLPVFRLPRKARKHKHPRLGGRTEYRYVREIRKVDPFASRCIAVDDPSHLFLCEGFIPTHNTNMARLLLGNTSIGERASALRNPYEVPEIGDVISKGRGMFEGLTSPRAAVIQAWYSPQAAYRERLSERRAPLADDERLVLPEGDPEEFAPGDSDLVWDDPADLPGMWSGPTVAWSPGMPAAPPVSRPPVMPFGPPAVPPTAPPAGPVFPPPPPADGAAASHPLLPPLPAAEPAVEDLDDGFVFNPEDWS